MSIFLLLPASARLRGTPLSPRTARFLARSNPLPAAASGRQAQLRRYFELPAGQWPLAALTRQDDCGDARDGLWLRADPCHIRPDLNGARLLAVSDTLVQNAATAQALLPELQAIFAEAGFRFDIGAPGRWYLQLPDDTALPDTIPPEDALGLDLLEHISLGETGRRWRALLNEVEITLHHHPHNAERIAAGQWPINSLWLWGGGHLPGSIQTPLRRCYSRDETALALAAAAGVAELLPTDALLACKGTDAAFDLTHLRSLNELDRYWLQPLLAALDTGNLRALMLDSEDGQRWQLRRAHRWRIWRAPWNLSP